MVSPGLNATLERYDRELGERLRGRVGARRGLAELFGVAADVMSPAYRVLVLTLILWRPTRARGLRAFAAAVLAAVIAKRLRDAIRRPRPGPRPDGGLPSRHAAASVAIAAILVDRRSGLGLPVALITAIGLVVRVTTGEHDPADVIAGALLGGIVARVTVRMTGGRRTAAAD
jgi:membrane-associated phospholipid phosphatase